MAKRKPKLPVVEARECASLGTRFRDIYRDGELFAVNLPDTVANWLIARPELLFGNIGAPVEVLRTYEIEREYMQMTKLDPAW